MRNDLFSTWHAAAVAVLAGVTLAGCGDAGVAEAVARVGDARPAQRAAAEAEPHAAAAAPAMAPRALPMPQRAGGAALHHYREDMDPSHMAIASYGD
jgi:hypothetical protein